MDVTYPHLMRPARAVLEVDVDEVVPVLLVELVVLRVVDEELVPVLELVLLEDSVDVVDVVLVLEELVVLVLEDDEVVDTDVVAEDVSVDVCVVDGDVISQLKKVPSPCRATSSLNAAARSCDRCSPVGMASSDLRTASRMCTCPTRSWRHETSKKVPWCRPASCCVISARAAARPGAVRLLHDSRSPVASVSPYRVGTL